MQNKGSNAISQEYVDSVVEMLSTMRAKERKPYIRVLFDALPSNSYQMILDRLHERGERFKSINIAHIRNMAVGRTMSKKFAKDVIEIVLNIIEDQKNKEKEFKLSVKAGRGGV